MTFATHLTPEALKAWAGTDRSRWEQIGRVGGGLDSISDGSALAASLRALGSIKDVDDDVLAAFVELCGKEMDPESRREILRALTDDQAGRRGQRAIDRLADARDAVKKYNALLKDPDAGETQLQACIEADPWLLGLEYTAVRGREGLPRGAMDFLLERFDGFHDLLELKAPQDSIIDAPGAGAAPPPAHDFSLSRALSNALAQVHVYRDTLTAESGTMERRYGLHQTEDPRALVVIGRTDLMTEHSTRVLRELNKSLHRVEIVPYDLIGKRAAVILDNVERYLIASNDGADLAA